MPTKTNEQAFEYAIEKALTGTCLEELKENPNGVADRQEIYRSGKVTILDLHLILMRNTL